MCTSEGGQMTTPKVGHGSSGRIEPQTRERGPVPWFDTGVFRSPRMPLRAIIDGPEREPG